jgi:hypothetical protein
MEDHHTSEVATLRGLRLRQGASLAQAWMPTLRSDRVLITVQRRERFLLTDGFNSKVFALQE